MASHRLSSLDVAFLDLERSSTPMHVAGLLVLDPSSRPDSRLPFGDVLATVESRLHLVPRFRRRLAAIPGGFAYPTWVDDARFDIGHHVRRAKLPAPGGRAELTEFAGRILSEPLDLSRPLWEMHVIEGLRAGRAAVLLKAHHALADGVAGMRAAAALLDPDPAARPGPPPHWEPAPAPGAMLARAIGEQAIRPLGALLRTGREILSAPGPAAGRAAAAVAGAREVLELGSRPKGPFDLNVGPVRRFAMADAPVGRFKAVKEALGGTVNDVVLAVVGGGIHRLLKARGEPSRGLSLRALVPVSVRAPGEGGDPGNRVVPAFVDIPVGPLAPKRRLDRIRESTRRAKASPLAAGTDAFIDLGSWLPPALHRAAARLISLGEWFNVAVSNVPGPQGPLYLAGARVLGNYPSAPLAEKTALSIACTSLGGTMAFGLTGDGEALADIDLLAAGLEDSLDDLSRAAGL